jgi:hypothetical protein
MKLIHNGYSAKLVDNSSTHTYYVFEPTSHYGWIAYKYPNKEYVQIFEYHPQLEAFCEKIAEFHGDTLEVS